MRVLLDTCVISEIVRPAGETRVKERVGQFSREGTFLSVITLGELAFGVARLKPGKKQNGYSAGLLQLEQSYRERILQLDVDTALIWGEIAAARQGLGRPLGAQDGLIAATALRHGLHVVTRNVKDFEDTGVRICLLYTSPSPRDRG